MKNVIYRVLVIIIFFTGNSAAQTGRESIKFRLAENFMVIVPIKINNTETLEFLLDTGTNTSIIVPEAAARLNLRPIDRIELVTPAGAVITPRSFLSSVVLGAKSAENVEVLWSDLSELRAVDKRLSGILGQNFLSHFNFTLSFREQRIDFGEARQKQFAKTLHIPFKADENGLLLILKTNESELRLVLDTGAAGLILFASGCRKLEKEIERSEQLMQVSTSAGSGWTQTGWLDKLQFGSKSLRRVQVAMLNETGRIEDGLLPLRLFNSVYFNNRERFVILNP